MPCTGMTITPGLARRFSSLTFIPHWYNAQFQDGMAICHESHKPDLFITMTCNPHWDETQLNGASVQDRTYVVARVFKQKKNRLMDDIMKARVFGVVPAHMWVIQFQKRGLPHVHILVILREEDRMTTAAQVNETICAKLPPHPDTAPTDEARARFEWLNRTVLTNMIHVPCGAQNPNSP